MKKAIFFALVFTSILLGNRADAEKLVIAWTAVSAFNSPFWVMNDAGFYKEEGLDVDTIYIPSSPIAAKATLAGETVISAQNSQVIADSGLQGADLVAIGATVNIVPFYVMAAPEIRTIADLKGKTVGVSRFGAATDFGMRMFLAKYGLAAHRDVAFIQIGGMPEIATALSKKIIAAAPMSYPMVYVAEQGGAKILANLARDEIPFVHLTLTTTKRFLKDKRPQVKAFLRAYGKAVHFLFTRKAESLAIFAKYTKIKDQKMLEGSLKYGYEFMEKVPFVKRAGFQVTLDEIARTNPKAKQAKPEQFFDNSLIQELVDEGFFAKLWGRNP
ncbi:MAG TPA: ABC transporter substrate-binding protein [Candidatus Eisenbacteria bacterium]|jgi:ABC-type nitrate/sulfonate/bicarbonate transport system substrate-binding protein|nr:ABC transporter substrate-binding protein [Candidatus Eisenbacteria bacterium]